MPFVELKIYAFKLLHDNVQFIKKIYILKMILFKIKMLLFESLLKAFFFMLVYTLLLFFTEFIKILKIHLKVLNCFGYLFW